MSTASSARLEVPPHLDAEVDATGTLRVRVRGPLDLAGFRRTLGEPRLSQLVFSVRPTAARLELSSLGATTDGAIAHAEGFWAHELVEAGTSRLVVVAERSPPPVLRLYAASWPYAGHALARPIGPGPGVPFAVVEAVVAGALRPLLAHGAGASEIDAAIAAAARGIDAATMPVRDGSALGVAGLLVVEEPLATERILSTESMRRLSAMLRSPAIAVAIPRRGQLLAAVPGAAPALAALAARAAAGPDALTPIVFSVEDGALRGPMALGATAAPAPALDPSQPILRARSDAEVHLYLDLRGVPRERARSVVRGRDGRDVVVFSAGSDRFGFTIADPGGTLGQGGDPEPSTILRPSELLTYADILTKAVPGSPEHVPPGERASVKTQLVTAAICLEEILKLIPPGASAVPESAFHGEAARAMYATEPGRFRGARLEVVAQTYRKIAERF